MDLPVLPPVAPMLARLARELPAPEGVLFEPKWDGFRCVVFRDGDEVELTSRNERPLTPYFPEVVEALRRELPVRCVVDGELLVTGEEGADFGALLLRLHPAPGRVARLSSAHPASFVAFDLLALDDRDLRALRFAERRRLLEGALAAARPPISLTPTTTRPEEAERWLDAPDTAGLDGVMVKPLDAPYREGQRTMLKVKRERTADCVVAGFRWYRGGDEVGSLLLGLHDDDGVLRHVGVATSFSAAVRRRLTEELASLRTALAGHPWEGGFGLDVSPVGRLPGAVSRWAPGTPITWEPLRPERVVEVAYDKLQGDRFRHATRFRRWRDDRDPASCRFDQFC